ncbi:hypothetical protein G9A89_005764 [Geosiphon pyriformis]|nr:hypothetical protein G9A89_005764 [Geosiphon pyriformis]
MKELIWNTNQAWETNNNQDEPSTWEWEENNKGKRKKREEKNVTKKTTDTKEINSGWTNLYSVYKQLSQPSYISLKYKDCGKKLFFMEA